MLLAALAVVALLGFLVVFKARHERKIDILVGMVIVMVLANYLNEVRSEMRATPVDQDMAGLQALEFSPLLYKPHSDKYFILPEQSRVEEYLRVKIQNNENTLVYFENLSFERFRLLFHNIQKAYPHVLATQISGRNPTQFDFFALSKQLKDTNYYYLIVQDFTSFNQLTILKNLFLRNRVSIILKNIPNNFSYHSISDLTERFRISQNSFYGQLTKRYTPQLISKCQQFTNIDYDFYLKSENTPLVDLCCNDLPSNPGTECIKRRMSHENQFVPVQEVKECLGHGDRAGIVFENGAVSVEKEYFWAGKCDSKVFANTRSGEL